MSHPRELCADTGHVETTLHNFLAFLADPTQGSYEERKATAGAIEISWLAMKAEITALHDGAERMGKALTEPIDSEATLEAELAALREKGSAHDAEVAAKARAEALEVECTRVCTNCSRRVAVRWCSKWKFFYHGEPRYACSASAIRELFAARWPDQFGPKEQL